MTSPKPPTFAKSATPPRSPFRRRLRTFGLVLAAFLVAGGALAAWRFDALVNRLKDQQTKMLSTKLDRAVTLGHLGAHLFPRPRVSLERLEIGPEAHNPEDRERAVVLEKADVSLAWSTVFSLGKKPRVQDVEIEGLTVNVVRYRDGTLNLQHIADKLAKPESEAPHSTEPPEAARAAVLDSLRFTGGTFRFFDRKGEAPDVVIRDLGIEGQQLGVGQRFTLTMAAAIAADAPNFKLSVKAAPAPEGSLVSTVEELHVALSPTDLGPFAPYLAALGAPAFADLEAARAEIALDLKAGAFAPGGHGPLALKSAFAVRQIKFKGGLPWDFSLSADVSGESPSSDLGDAEVHAKDLTLRFGTAAAPMQLVARGKVSHLGSAPRFDGVDVHSEGFDFGKIAALYPRLAQDTGLNLRGPFGLEAKASGSADAQVLTASFDASQAFIELPRQFRKPAGVPLRAELEARTTADAVELGRAALTLSDWELVVHGRVTELKTASPRLDLKAEAKAPAVAGLLRLLPPVADTLPAGAQLAGSLTVNAAAQGTSQDLKGHADVVLSGLNVKVPDARLGGGGQFHATFAKQGVAAQADVHAEMHADFASLEAIYTDVLHKNAGTPLGFDVTLKQKGPKAEVDLAVRAATLNATGEVAKSGDAFNAKLNVPPFHVNGLGAMLPTVRTLGLGDIRAGARVTASGNTQRPEELHVVVDDLTLKGARTDVTGRLDLKNPSHPRVDFEASGSMLDVDEILPPAPGAAAKKKGDHKSAGKARGEDGGDNAGPSPLADVEGRARIDVKRARASDIELTNLKADFALSRGIATAHALSVGVFGGTFEGAGTEVDLAAPNGTGHFRAKGALKDVDISAALARFAGSPDLLQGRLSADVDLRGGGTTPDLLASTLEGALHGRLEHAVFPAASLAGDLAAPLAQKVSGWGTLGKVDPEAWAKKLSDKTLGDLDLGLSIVSGAATLSKPLETKTPYGPASLAGRVLLRGSLDLKGTVSLSPESVSALLGDRVALDQPLPVVVAITGPLRTPHVAPANLEAVVRALAAGYAKAAARQAATGAAKDLAASALSKTPLGANPVETAAELQAKAEAKAKEMQGQAQAQARAQVQAEQAALAARQAEAEASARAQAAQAQAAAEAVHAKAKGEAAEQLRQQTEQAQQQAAAAKAQADEAKKQTEQKARDKLRGVFGN